MTIGQGRIVRAELAGSAESLRTNLHAHVARRISKEELAAQDRAREILADAERQAADVRDRAVAEGRAEGFAEAAALAVKLRERATASEADTLTDAVDLARVIAERLLGHALVTDPAAVAHLARTALAEARGARRIVIVATVEDAEVLRPVLSALDPDKRIQEVRVDPSLGRGDLRLETDAGTLDARLGPSIDRLAVRLTEALRR